MKRLGGIRSSLFPNLSMFCDLRRVMIEAKLKFESEAQKEKYVHVCDDRFEADVDAVMKELCARKELKYLTLSGPSCSGKTTASRKLISEFAERGRKVKIISLDDFFRDRDELVKEANGGKLDFDSEKALDIEALSEFMENLQAGKEAILPKFDFNEARRVSEEKFSRGDADVIVFEGIQAIYPAFTDLLDRCAHDEKASVYIKPMQSIKVEEYVIDSNELRLWRRLVRDYNFRSASPEFTCFLWETVRENEDKNIFPYENKSDYFINSTLGYDVGMLKNSLEKILSPIKETSKYYKKSREILDIVAKSDAIPREYLPKNSLYFEFV